MTGVTVTDPIKAFKFYTEILGFAEHTFMPEMQLAIIVSSEDKEGTTLLLEPRGQEFVKNYYEKIKEMKLPVIIFGVKDVQAEFERLTALGVEFLKEPVTNEWGTQAIFDDTCGNYIQIHQDA